MDFRGLENFMERLTKWRIPGNSVRVYYEGREVYRHSAGYADVENKIPMTGNELLNIYSCSKVATMVGILRLYERGYFLLDDPLYEYMPEYRHMGVRQADGSIEEAKTPLTIRHLCTMTSGIDYSYDRKGLEIAREKTNGKMNTETVARCMAQDPLNFEPGSHWQYGLGHDVIGGLIALIAGMPFREYMRQNVFEPLGMYETYYHATEETASRMAEQYRYVTASDSGDTVQMQSHPSGDAGYWKNEGKIRNAHIMGSEYDSGGAGIITSVGDYGKLVNALACGGTSPEGYCVLSRGTVELMRTNQLTEAQRKDFSWAQLKGYGYGLGVRTLMDRAASGTTGSVGEFGWGGAAGATVLADPDRKFGIFYAHHMLNPQEDYYQPRLRNTAYAGLDAES